MHIPILVGRINARAISSWKLRKVESVARIIRRGRAVLCRSELWRECAKKEYYATLAQLGSRISTIMKLVVASYRPAREGEESVYRLNQQATGGDLV